MSRCVYKREEGVREREGDLIMNTARAFDESSRLEDRSRGPGVRCLGPLVSDLLRDKVVESRRAARAVLVRFRLRLVVCEHGA